MSTCLSAGRTNSAQIAKVHAQRNLRAALQTLAWHGGRETGKLKTELSLFNVLIFPMCVFFAVTVFLLVPLLFTTGYGVGFRGYGCILLTEFMFFVVFF